jgi:hypothetical protein
MLPVSGALGYEDFQGTGESVWDYYNDDGSVTLYNTVDAVEYSWPSGYMSYENTVDLNETPYIHLNFRCDSGFNCGITYLDEAGETHSVNLSTLADLQTTDYTADSYDEYLDFKTYLEENGQFPADGKVKITKVTYYVVGPKDCYARLYDLSFTGKAADLKPMGFSLSFEDTVLVNFYFTAEGLENAEFGMLVFDADPQSVDIGAAREIYPAVYVDNSESYMAQTSGISAKEMGDTRYYAAYAKLPNGSYCYSTAHSYSWNRNLMT